MSVFRHERILLWATLLVATACGARAQPAAESSRQQNLRATSNDGAVLAGTLFLPPGDGPFASVILIHGSEPGERNNYSRFAERITARGLAVLAFDKRGVGESDGTYVEAPDLAVPAADVVAWHARLREHPALRPDAVGVLGWSQGGWIGPLAASMTDIAFVVMISGPAVSPLRQNVYDKGNQAARVAPDDAAADRAREVVRAVMTYLVRGTGRDSAETNWRWAQDQAWFREGYSGIPMMDRDILTANERGRTFIAHNAYEPAPALAALEVPVLAVYGDADPIVPVGESLDRLAEIFRGREHLLDIIVYPGADHGIRIPDGDAGAAFAPGYPDEVLDWLAGMVD